MRGKTDDGRRMEGMREIGGDDKIEYIDWIEEMILYPSIYFNESMLQYLLYMTT
jgi:hypothetical protein